MPAPFWIEPNSPVIDFPDVSLALDEPDGLLAVGGDLSMQRLLKAYRSGIFPWYSADQPILWWSPDPRFVLFPAHLKISRSLRKAIRKQVFSISMNKDFEAVIRHCSSVPRPGQNGTWITDEMQQAYLELHQAGYAHSVEAWYNNELVGGLYGVAIGKVFFGESMFSQRTDASKVAFAGFIQYIHTLGFELVDCQVHTMHLQSLGAELIPRPAFIHALEKYCDDSKLLSKHEHPLLVI